LYFSPVSFEAHDYPYQWTRLRSEQPSLAQRLRRDCLQTGI
jgi:hypothetical protein